MGTNFFHGNLGCMGGTDSMTVNGGLGGSGSLAGLGECLGLCELDRSHERCLGLTSAASATASRLGPGLACMAELRRQSFERRLGHLKLLRQASAHRCRTYPFFSCFLMSMSNTLMACSGCRSMATIW